GRTAGGQGCGVPQAALRRGRASRRSPRLTGRPPSRRRRSPIVLTVLAAIAASWGVAMALAPLLQIRQIRRHRSSRSVSVAYQQVLLVGFVLWLAYGLADTKLALIVPNTVATVVSLATIAVVFRYR